MQTRLKLLLILIALLSFAIFSCGGDDDDDSAPANEDDDDMFEDDDDDDNNDASDDDDDDNDTGPDPIDDGSFTDDTSPFVSGLDDRIEDFLDECAADGLAGGGMHTQVCILATEAGNVLDAPIDSALAKMAARSDCADFRLSTLVRILAKYADSPYLSQSQYDRIYDGILNFSYWMDEPGTDEMNYQTENHSILFHSSAYILGDLYPDETFINSGLKGSELRDKAAHYIDLWLDYRLRFGFTEFHSNVYYNETIPGLANLADLTNDGDISVRAAMALDIILLDMALNNHEGVFGVAHGRSYMKDKQSLETEDTKTTMWVMFGKGNFYGKYDSMSAVALADSENYRMPAVVESIGSARPRGLVSKEKISMNLADGPDYGIGHDDFDDGVYWWSMNGFMAPEILDLTYEMCDAWEMLVSPSPFAVFSFFKPLYNLGILESLGWQLYPLIGGNAIEQANTYVYRTPEVMLASAQDYKPSILGTQVHLWQATLGWDALIFTTYPGGLVDDSAAGQWTGGWNPRVAQHRTAAIILYRKPDIPLGILQPVIDNILPNYTHAFIPKEAFDEIIQEGKWTFGRKDDGYFALYSTNETYWREEGEWADKELVADGRENVWICEVGDSTMYESFEEFQNLILQSTVSIGDDLAVIYSSPGQGEMTYSWSGDFTVNGQTVSQSDYMRFDNPFITKEFDGTDPYVVERGELKLELDPENLTRTVTE